jgi:hypothetical protein
MTKKTVPNTETKITRHSTTSTVLDATIINAIYEDNTGNELRTQSITRDGRPPVLDAQLICRNGSFIEGKRAENMNGKLKNLFTTKLAGITAPQEDYSAIDIKNISPMEVACRPETRGTKGR